MKRSFVTLAVASFVAGALAAQPSRAAEDQEPGVGGDNDREFVSGDWRDTQTPSERIRWALDESLEYQLEPSDLLASFFRGATIESVKPFLGSGQLLQHAAGHADDARLVTFLIRHGFDPNEAFGPGIPAYPQDLGPDLRAGPLHYAAQYNPNPAIVEAFLEGGAYIHAVGGLGLYTPLHEAAQHNNAAVVSALIEGGARHDAINGRISSNWSRGPNINGNTALHMAATNEDARVIDVLVDAGADVNRRNSSGLTPLHFAVLSKRAASISTLVRRGADPDAAITFIKEAAGDETHDCTGCNPIHLLVDSLIGDDSDVAKFEDLSRLLVGAGANVRAHVDEHGMYEGYSALRLAVEGEVGSGVVALLMELGARVEPELLHAVFEERFQYSGRYAGANNARAVGSTDNLEVLDMLIGEGANVNSRDDCGRTLLHRAVSLAHGKDHGLEQAVEKLIAAGADVNAHVVDSPEPCSGLGYTPLHEVAWKGSKSAYAIAAMLLDAGADPRLPDRSGNTARDVASSERMAELLDAR